MLASFGVPRGKEEEWRFTPLRRLRGLHSDADLGAGKVAVGVDAESSVAVSQAKYGDERLGVALRVPDRVSARAYEAFGEATVISVPAGVESTRPTWVSVRGEDGEAAAAGHIAIHVGENARAVVVIEYSGAATYADNVELVVGDGGALTLVSLQEWDSSAVHLSYQQARMGRDSRLSHTAVTLGGSVVRVAPTVHFAEPGAEAELRGLYFADAGQHLEHRLFIDHQAAKCRSRVSYKGALQGEGAHAVWIGDVMIAPSATGTDTYEYNRNLVLSDGTRVDSVPNLEILTGEVAGAGHASASGRLEDHHLFYLMARGIPFDEARRLVVRGFFGDLIGQIEVAELRERLLAEIENELTALPGAPSEPRHPKAGSEGEPKRRRLR